MIRPCLIHTHMPGGILTGVAQLTRLTSLTLEGDWAGQQEPLQLLLAARLPLQQLHLGLENRDRSAAVPPHYLTSLGCTQLKQLSCNAVLDDATVLPAHQQRLCLMGCGSGLKPVLQLQQLQQLKVTFQPLEQQPTAAAQLGVTHWQERSLLLRDALTGLALLPALQHVSLDYTSTDGFPAQLLAAGSAGAWGQMPQLRELRLRFPTGGGDTRSIEQIFEGLAAATSLTMLSLQPDIS
jgi:hypothetical protein